MEFFIYLLLILVVILSLIFGIYFSIIAFEELPELYDAIKFFRIISILGLIGCVYFLDVNVHHKIIFSVLIIIAFMIKSLYPNIKKYGEYLLFILFGFVINISLENTSILLPILFLIILSNFLLSSLMFNRLILKDKPIKISNKYRVYSVLFNSMIMFMISFFVSSLLFYFII